MSETEDPKPDALELVEPFHDDVLVHGYRSCDFCHESCCDDIWNGKPWRKFYHSDRDGLNVCEHCIPQYTKEDGGP
jgi:hypothetical protein